MKKKELDHRKIEELYDAGRTDREIAASLGVKREAICAWRTARRLPSNDVKNARNCLSWKRMLLRHVRWE